MISVKHLTKKFNKNKSNEVVAVDDVSIEFPQTGIVCLFGHSGSGKTTILNIVGGLDKPTEGSIKFDDQTVVNYDLIRSKRIGYVFQNYNLFNNLSVFDNVSFVLKMLGVNDDNYIKKQVEYSLGLVNMLPFARKKASELSGGQQQRVAIARALVKNPDFIIADEPTGNIDSKNKIEIMNILQEISKHKLIILVTHEENIASFYADRIITLKDGKIISDALNEKGVSGQFREENKIYLSDLLINKELNEDNVKIQYHGEEGKEIGVRLIYQLGTLYIETDEDIRIDLIDKNTRVKVYDQRLDEGINDQSQTNFQYENLQIDEEQLGKRKLFNFVTSVKVSVSKIFNQNVRGKLLIAALILAGLLIAVGATNIGTALGDNIDTSLMPDSNFYQVITNEPGGIVLDNDDDLYQYGQHLPQIHIMLDPVGFNKQNIYETYASLAVTEELHDSEISGNRPVNDHQIIISKTIAKQLTSPNGKYGFWNYDSLIGKKITIFQKLDLTISGIANRDGVTIFANKNAARLWGFVDSIRYQFMHETWSLEDTSPNIIMGRLPTEHIEDDVIEVVITKHYYDDALEVGDSFDEFYLPNMYSPIANDLNFVIRGEIVIFDDGINVEDFVRFKMLVVGIVDNVSAQSNIAFARSKDLLDLNEKVLKLSQTYYIYTSSLDVANRLSDKYLTTNYLDHLIQQERNNQQNNLLSVFIFSGVLITLSAVGYYFIAKSELMKQIYQINVYRSLGVRKSEIIKVFFIDSFVLTTLSSLIGYLLYVIGYLYLSAGIFGTVGIMITHWPSLIIGLIVMYLVNVVFGVLPVISLLRKTPADIMRTYDL